MTRADNVIELDSGKRRPQNNRTSLARNDKRMYPRLESDDRLFVQVVLCAPEPDLIGTTVACRAVNLSIGGIQFRTDVKMPLGSLLDLWVDIRSRPGKFFLAGEVRWVRPTAESEDGAADDWIVGAQLRPGAATDIVEWQEFHVQANVR